ncbi:MAG: UDP-N-acetylmuramoyl-L-alanyl-D-glutamate--2,6-diaminopimelate ligase, partial [Firmicutes bacterium]|nr:UDP-N-acetylmuramoyl-L-alanyl-D-glutamate--2,6-diaminopimelate ligase [Bacillota bacterium]
VRGMKLIAVTGTNGKTSTTYIVKHIAAAAGVKTAVIGTHAVMIGDTTHPASLTTPDPIELHGWFARMRDENVQWVVMEASAHAIALKKLDGIVADIAVFTNLSRDHLDFFGTMERYKAAKASYFCKEYARMAVVNADDDAGVEILNAADIPCFTYGADPACDVSAQKYRANTRGQKYTMRLFDESREVVFALPGRHNMYNTLCAASAAKLLGADTDAIVRGIAAVREIPGRFNMINAGRYGSVVIDYAHTPDGLENILKTVREFCKGRLVTVFGCGGDRDRSKRPQMGKIAGGLSDLVFVTSDNPRTEDPEAIIDGAVEGLRLSGCAYERIIDRAGAIERALRSGRKGDIIVIAGKGSEPYMDVKGIKRPYSDKETVLELLKLLK